MESDSSHKVQIIVAVLALVGVLATAVLSNWGKLFPTPPPPTSEFGTKLLRIPLAFGGVVCPIVQ